MILDVILIVLLVLMMLYGYKKGCIGIVAKLVSALIALVLAYLLAQTVGEYISATKLGLNITDSIENSIMEKLDDTEKTTVISLIQSQLSVDTEKEIVQKVTNYVFIGIGFVLVFVATRIILFIGQKILESIFDLPVLKTFNKLGGVVAAVILCILEVSIILTVIKSISAFEFSSTIVQSIDSSVIIKVLYEHNIFTNLILSKII